jgi:hypothetical protein
MFKADLHTVDEDKRKSMTPHQEDGVKFLSFLVKSRDEPVEEMIVAKVHGISKSLIEAEFAKNTGDCDWACRHCYGRFNGISIGDLLINHLLFKHNFELV